MLHLTVVFLLKVIFFKGKKPASFGKSVGENGEPRPAPELRREPARLLIHDTRFAHVKKTSVGRSHSPNVAFFFFFKSL